MALSFPKHLRPVAAVRGLTLASSLVYSTSVSAHAPHDVAPWTSLTAVDRIEAEHALWRFSAGWSLEDDPDASAGRQMQADSPGVQAEIQLLGVGFDLLGGRTADGGTIEVRVDALLVWHTDERSSHRSGCGLGPRWVTLPCPLLSGLAGASRLRLGGVGIS